MICLIKRIRFAFNDEDLYGLFTKRKTLNIFTLEPHRGLEEIKLGESKVRLPNGLLIQQKLLTALSITTRPYSPLLVLVNLKKPLVPFLV